jgi:hypothetical protein
VNASWGHHPQTDVARRNSAAFLQAIAWGEEARFS